MFFLYVSFLFIKLNISTSGLVLRAKRTASKVHVHTAWNSQKISLKCLLIYDRIFAKVSSTTWLFPYSNFCLFPLRIHHADVGRPLSNTTKTYLPPPDGRREKCRIEWFQAVHQHWNVRSRSVCHQRGVQVTNNMQQQMIDMNNGTDWSTDIRRHCVTGILAIVPGKKSTVINWCTIV
jgi:hypothetical protein